MVGDGSPTTIHAALRMVYENGWHGYWVNPGEGGMKTELRWKLPAGVKAGEVHFPIPKRETTGELVTYGYTCLVYTHEAADGLTRGQYEAGRTWTTRKQTKHDVVCA